MFAEFVTGERDLQLLTRENYAWTAARALYADYQHSGHLGCGKEYEPAKVACPLRVCYCVRAARGDLVCRRGSSEQAVPVGVAGRSNSCPGSAQRLRWRRVEFGIWHNLQRPGAGNMGGTGEPSDDHNGGVDGAMTR